MAVRQQRASWALPKQAKTKKTKIRRNCAYERPLLSKKEFQDSAERGKTPSLLTKMNPIDVLECRKPLLEGPRLIDEFFFIIEDIVKAETTPTGGISSAGFAAIKDRSIEIKERTHAAIRDGNLVCIEYGSKNEYGNPTNAVYCKPGDEPRARQWINYSSVSPEEINHVILGRLMGYPEDDINAFLAKNCNYVIAMKQHAAALKAGIQPN